METITDGPADATLRFLFAHGAGGPMDSPFMTTVAQGLGDRGIRVIRFEFPYMDARRRGGKRGAPDRQPILLEAWRQAIDQERAAGALFIGGKSLGGRIATMVADEKDVKGLICFGYPFHPPGKPAQLRTKHLESLRTPALIIQGERDPFGGVAEVAGYPLSPSIDIAWLSDGDHSFKPRKSSGSTEAQNLQRAIDLATQFMRRFTSA